MYLFPIPGFKLMELPAGSARTRHCASIGKGRAIQNTANIKVVFDYIKQLLIPAEQVNSRRIGFRRMNERKQV